MSNDKIVVERSVISPVEEAAKEAISIISTKKDELKGKRKLLEEKFLRSEKYASLSEDIKETQKVKAEEKKKLLKEPDIAKLSEEIKELSRTVNDTQLSLFDYLLEYKNTTGKNTIQDNTGQSYDITVQAKIKI